MCPPKSNNSAAAFQQQEATRARAAEQARAAQIRTGQGQIDQQFAGFNDDFYGQRETAFNNFYQPQLDESYNDALANLTFSLARAGTLNSSIAGQSRADLQKRKDEELAALSQRQSTDVNNLRTRVANEKSALTSQLNATGNSDAIANDATTRAGLLHSEDPQFVPIGDVFSGIGSSIGAWRGGFDDGSRTQAFNTTIGNARRPTSTVIR